MSLNRNIQTRLLALVQDSQNEQASLNNALRLLSKWRSALIQNTLLQQQGTVVLNGPLQGLDFLDHSAEGCHIAKLLGCYEQPLLPFISAAIEAGYQTVLNIGCAEGYYAVGMARKMPATRMMAFDLSVKAQQACKLLATKNGVAEQVEVGGLFDHANFASYAHQKVLVLCDIEGGERELLDPSLAPALNGMDLIVEAHECLTRGIVQTLIDRFKSSHEITLVEDNGQRQLPVTPSWFNNLAHLDQLLATWEWRSGPTPWLVMKSKRLATA